MKRTIQAALKLLLVLTIFIGLQGKVIIRFLEVSHKNEKRELAHSGAARIKKAVIHCNLQCYTQHFQVLDLPLVAFFFSLITVSFIISLLFISFKEKLSIAGSVRLLPLRAPPAFN